MLRRSPRCYGRKARRTDIKNSISYGGKKASDVAAHPKSIIADVAFEVGHGGCDKEKEMDGVVLVKESMVKPLPGLPLVTGRLIFLTRPFISV